MQSNAMRRTPRGSMRPFAANKGDRYAPAYLSCWINRGDPRHSFLFRAALSALMTVIVEEPPTYSGEIPSSNYLAWTPAVAGALIATAFSTILIAFGAALGLGVASTAPTWRDASVALWLLSGIYLILVALISFGVGGYAAGHIRANAGATDTADFEHRYGMHGLAAWAIAVVLTVLITALIGSAALSRTP